MRLGSGGRFAIEQSVDLGQRRLVAHRREQLTCLGERFRRRAAEGELAAALAEQGVGALGNVPELLPAVSRLGVERGCFGPVPRGLGELGPAGAQRVLG